MNVEEPVPPRNQEQQVTATDAISKEPPGPPGEKPAGDPGQQAAGQAKKPSAAPGGQPKPREFRPDIQGLRALAVGMVVFYHLYPSLMTGGFAGVDVFFVISGFLITGHLLREYRKTGRIGLLEFWGRRAKRLVPAAALVLTVTWAASRLVLPATRLADTAAQIRASALYYQNWQLAVERGQLPQVGQRGEPGAALLVAVRRGAVLPGLAVPVRPRGGSWRSPCGGGPGTPGKTSSRRGVTAGTTCSSCWRARSSPARSATRSITRGSTRRAPTS